MTTRPAQRPWRVARRQCSAVEIPHQQQARRQIFGFADFFEVARADHFKHALLTQSHAGHVSELGGRTANLSSLSADPSRAGLTHLIFLLLG